MKRILAALALSLAAPLPAAADCLDDRSFHGVGEIKTQGGGLYSYGLTVGGPAEMRGTLTGGPRGIAEQSFDLKSGYHIGFGGEGLARFLAPEATAAEADSALLYVRFAPKGKLPAAVPGKAWTGRVSATVFAYADGDNNGRNIAEARLEGSYTFLDERRADISGCSYRIIPVEMKLTRMGETALQRRILYFPDLGVSAITLWGPDAEGGQVKTGILGMGYPE